MRPILGFIAKQILSLYTLLAASELTNCLWFELRALNFLHEPEERVGAWGGMFQITIESVRARSDSGLVPDWSPWLKKGDGKPGAPPAP